MIISFSETTSKVPKSSLGEDFIWGIEAGEVADFSKDHSAHAVADTGNGENGGSDPVHHLLKGSFDLADSSVEFADEVDGMLKFKGFGGMAEPMERLAALQSSMALERS